MVLRRLKSMRRVVSMVFLILIALLFLDFRESGLHALAREILYLQFVPSLVNFLGAATLAAAGFAFVLGLTVLCGRVYCSSICPLGTFQDLIHLAVRRRRGHRLRLRFANPRNGLRYGILAATVLLLFAGSSLLLNLLDPFSVFGRMLANLGRPLVLGLNNAAASVLEQTGVHLLYQVQWPVSAPLSIAVSLVMLVLVGVLAGRYGRLYCNTVCPVGALLGLVARFSRYQIDIDPEACKGCRLCESVCKANCIDSRRLAVDASRCVSCFNCFEVCPEEGAMRFDNRWRKKTGNESAEKGRRLFILGSLLWLLGLAAARVSGQTGPAVQASPATVPVPETTPVCPPGSVSLAHFNSKCTACHLCVGVCPSQVLVPSAFAYGLSGLMQPRLDFLAGHCNYDCTACLEVCPSGAILPLAVEEKRITQLGVAKFIQENCVVHTDRTNCGACSEHCPTKAVDMVPYLDTPHGLLVIPKIDETICIGCGGCEYACPTKPFKAIYVDGNPVHQLARKPEVKKIDVKESSDKGFPF